MLICHTTIFTRHNFVTNKIYWDFRCIVQPSGTSHSHIYVNVSLYIRCTERGRPSDLRVHQSTFYFDEHREVVTAMDSSPFPRTSGSRLWSEKRQKFSQNLLYSLAFPVLSTTQWIRNSRNSYTKFIRRIPLYLCIYFNVTFQSQVYTTYPIYFRSSFQVSSKYTFTVGRMCNAEDICVNMLRF